MESKNITIEGGAHHSARGNLENITWRWFIGIDGKLSHQCLERDKGIEFIRKIKPHLPEDYGKYMKAPEHIPDVVGWSFSIPLEKTTNPKEVEEILKKYFPGVYLQ